MSLADRKKALEEEEATKNQIPNGDYKVRLKDWKFGKSKSGADMYTLTWKIVSKGDQKGKERRTFYVVGKSWALNNLLDLITDFGADLSKMEELTEIDDVLEQVEDTRMPKAMMNIENIDGKRFPKLVLSDVEKVLTPASTKDDGDDGDDDDINTPD